MPQLFCEALAMKWTEAKGKRASENNQQYFLAISNSKRVPLQQSNGITVTKLSQGKYCCQEEQEAQKNILPLKRLDDKQDAIQWNKIYHSSSYIHQFHPNQTNKYPPYKNK